MGRTPKETSSPSQTALLQILSGIATRFLGLESRGVDGAVHTALGELGEFFGAARIHVAIKRPGCRVVDVTHQWCIGGTAPTQDRLQGLELDRFGAFGDVVFGTETLHIPSVSGIPLAARGLASLARAHGVQSVLGVPMSHGKALRGFLAMTFRASTERWPDETLTVVRAVANAIASALASKQAEEALRQREAQLRTVVESLPFDFFAIGQDGRYFMQNDACRANWGDVVGKRPADVAPSVAMRAIWEDNNRRAFAGEVVSDEVAVDPGGELRHYHNIISPIMEGGVARGILGVNIDVTDQRRAEQAKAEVEEQLRRAQRLEAVGTLAGGVAHDFNNLLVGILGHAQLIRRRAEEGSSISASAQVIDQAASRAAELTRQLLAFARRGKLRDVPVDVHRVVTDVVAIVRPGVGRALTIHQRLDATDHTCQGDPGQLQQVVLNLAVNACDAMPDGGTLTFETMVTNVGEVGNDIRPAVKAGPHLMLSVSDTGPGIPEEARTHIFEPFFTTKPAGEGTGMGLSTAYGIVANHGGWLALDDSQRGTTTFRVGLPLTDQPEVITESPADSAAAVGGAGRVLVVDDEETVRGALLAMLGELGCTVTAVGSGGEAIERFGTEAAAYDLVVVDLTMPGMDGVACLRALRKMAPTLPAIITTGKALDTFPDGWADLKLRHLLLKPFGIDELSRVVAAALGPAREGSA